MKVWYRAVCNEHKTWCDVFCDNPGRTAHYFASEETNSIIGDWLREHYGCELRLVWRDDQLDELWKTVDYWSNPLNKNVLD